MDRAGSPTMDREALLALYWSSGGPRWKKNQGWADNAEDMRTWHGVNLDGDGRVLRLDLQRNGLDGTIPAALGCLGNLIYLRMSFNRLTGPIPCTFGNLTRLNYLDIRSNQLTGSIPADLGKLTDISKVDFSCNQLGGHIPSEMGNMTGLMLCWLEKNHILGPIPAELADIPQLADLDLTDNRLEEGRLQGHDLKVWKEQARRQLIAAQSGRGSTAMAAPCGGGNMGGGSGGGTVDMKQYLDNMVAKDQEIAALKAENEQLRRGKSGSAVRNFFNR